MRDESGELFELMKRHADGSVLTREEMLCGMRLVDTLPGTKENGTCFCGEQETVGDFKMCRVHLRIAFSTGR